MENRGEHMKNILDLLIVGLYRIIAYPSIVINRWVLRGHYYGEVDVLSGFVFWTLCYQLVWGDVCMGRYIAGSRRDVSINNLAPKAALF